MSHVKTHHKAQAFLASTGTVAEREAKAQREPMLEEINNETLSEVLSEPHPCHWCRYYYGCAMWGMACESFIAYTNGRKWSDKPRIPSREDYKKAFPPCDNCEPRRRECQ